MMERDTVRNLYIAILILTLCILIVGCGSDKTNDKKTDEVDIKSSEEAEEEREEPEPPIGTDIEEISDDELLQRQKESDSRAVEENADHSSYSNSTDPDPEVENREGIPMPSEDETPILAD